MLGRGWGKTLVRGNSFHKTLNKDVGKKTTRKRIRKQEVR